MSSNRKIALLPILLSVFVSTALSMTCRTRDGSIVPLGHVMHNMDDECMSDVCRCASEDRCEIVQEKRMVLVRVNETKQMAGGQPPLIVTQLMQCTCVDHLPGSTEMDFLCKSPTQPGRDVGAKMRGCQDFESRLQMPGEKVRILTRRNEALQCDCSNEGNPENCLPENDPGDTCLDAVTNKRVPLGDDYSRLEFNSRGLPIRLRCVCVRSDQETSCTIV